MAAAADLRLAPDGGPAPAPVLALSFELKLRLPDGRGLEQLLIEAGIGTADAASAARLALGHLGNGSGGCAVTLALSRPLGGGAALRLERLTLATQAEATVIERRNGELVIGGQSALSARRPRIA